MIKNNGINIYNELEVGITDLRGGESSIVIKALLNSVEIGKAILEEPSVSVFHQEGYNELGLVSIVVDERYEGEGVINFLVHQVMEFANNYNRVITVSGSSFPVPYLVRRGFIVESVTENDIFVYGEDYRYNLENIEMKYYEFLDEGKLDRIDKRFIESKIRRREKLKKEREFESIMIEMEQEISNLFENTAKKLDDLGFGDSSFSPESFYNQTNYKEEKNEIEDLIERIMFAGEVEVEVNTERNMDRMIEDAITGLFEAIVGEDEPFTLDGENCEGFSVGPSRPLDGLNIFGDFDCDCCECDDWDEFNEDDFEGAKDFPDILGAIVNFIRENESEIFNS